MSGKDRGKEGRSDRDRDRDRDRERERERERGRERGGGEKERERDRERDRERERERERERQREKEREKERGERRTAPAAASGSASARPRDERDRDREDDRKRPRTNAVAPASAPTRASAPEERRPRTREPAAPPVPDNRTLKEKASDRRERTDAIITRPHDIAPPTGRAFAAGRGMGPGMARGRGFFRGGPGRGGPFPPVQPAAPRKEINRQEVCPLLLRVFVKKDEHHNSEQFLNRAIDLVDDEVQIYTWKDATLSELAQLIQQVKPFAREPNMLLEFNLISATKGKFTPIRMGTVRSEATRRSIDDRKALQDTSFETGDFLDVAVKSFQSMQMAAAAAQAAATGAGAAVGVTPAAEAPVVIQA